MNIAPVLDTNCGLPFVKTDALTYDTDQKLWKNSHEGGLTAMENTITVTPHPTIHNIIFDIWIHLIILVKLEKKNGNTPHPHPTPKRKLACDKQGIWYCDSVFRIMI